MSLNPQTLEMLKRLSTKLTEIAETDRTTPTNLTDIAILITQNNYIQIEILKQLTDIRENQPCH